MRKRLIFPEAVVAVLLARMVLAHNSGFSIRPSREYPIARRYPHRGSLARGCSSPGDLPFGFAALDSRALGGFSR